MLEVSERAFPCESMIEICVVESFSMLKSGAHLCAREAIGSPAVTTGIAFRLFNKDARLERYCSSTSSWWAHSQNRHLRRTGLCPRKQVELHHQSI